MYRIRITKPPVMARYGGENGEWGMGNGLFVAAEGGEQSGMDDRGTRSYLARVPRHQANIEAERGETVLGPFSRDGVPDHFKIGGERHTQGGTPLSVPDGSFIFSDTKKLKIGGPVVGAFGKSDTSKKKYTFAQLAKQYDLNRYKAILKDPASDLMDQKTAALMLQNYQQKLAQLALLQEGMKGFPQGIPGIAMPLVQGMVGSEGGDERGRMADDGGGGPITDGAGYAGMNSGMPQGGGQMADDGSGGGMPMAQWGGSRGNVQPTAQQVALYNKMANYVKNFHAPGAPQSRLLYAGDFNPGDYRDVVYPGYLPDNHQTNVPWVQQRRKDGLYGTQDWDMNDFFKRHPWVQQVRPNFNPTNAADVGWFQNEYNQRYHNLWGQDYFDGTGHRKIDSKFGQGTYSTPSVVTQEEPDLKPSTYKVPLEKIGTRGTIDANVVPQELYSYLNKKEKEKGKEKDKMPWWQQDKINLGASMLNRYNLQKYMPTYVGTNAVLPNATFFDPTRQLAANQEAAAQQNMMAGLFAGPQRLRSVGSNIQGQGATNAANILAQVQNQNVGVANQLEGMRSEMLNNQALRNAIARKTYLDEVTTANQQYDNSKMLANQNVVTNLQSGITNAQKTNWVNRMNPYFNIDPTTGRLSFTNNGKGIKSSAVSSYGSNPLSLYKTSLDQYNSLFPSQANSDRAYAFAEHMALGNKTRYGVDSDGDESMSTSGYVPNAQAQALLGTYGR